jgi:PLP dependent protein
MDEALLKERLEMIRRDVQQEAEKGGFPAPKIIAVTKTHPVEEILPLQGLGQVDIGENRVQEVVEKLPSLEEKFRIHLIGRLQSNKVKYIIEHVCLIHSVDRLSLAEEIDRQAQKHGRIMPVLLQVSPVGEPQKGGVLPEDAEQLLRDVAKLPGLKVQGLMAVMPKMDDEERLSGLFADMRTLFEHLRDEGVDGVSMEELSMGMSGDYKIAARHGATMVRIGSALMGPRNYDLKV